MTDQAPPKFKTVNRLREPVEGKVQMMVVSDHGASSVDYWMNQPAGDAMTAFLQIMRQRRAAANQHDEMKPLQS